MRKAQQRMETSMPYVNKIREVMGHVAGSHSEYRHHFLQPRNDIKAVGYLLISTDRGLCGGLNINLFKTVLQNIKTWRDKEIRVDLSLFGSKAVSYFKHISTNVIARTDRIGDIPTVSKLIGGVKVMLDAYVAGNIDRLFIAHNVFVNKMVQKPNIAQLLPLEVDRQIKSKYWDYIYEPDPKKLLDALIRRYIETQVYQAIVDNLACEQAARMIAMKNATDNAEEFLNHLKLIYNKARQAAITQEIAEIIGGAESV
jgi:F-type H+-transporting ATPase subunit gamma